MLLKFSTNNLKKNFCKNRRRRFYYIVKYDEIFRKQMLLKLTFKKIFTNKIENFFAKIDDIDSQSSIKLFTFIEKFITIDINFKLRDDLIYYLIKNIFKFCILIIYE